jgi:hypothetical protein
MTRYVLALSDAEVARYRAMALPNTPASPTWSFAKALPMRQAINERYRQFHAGLGNDLSVRLRKSG